MSTKRYEQWEVEDFTIRTYGDGNPVSMCIGGLAFAPDDYNEFAEDAEGTMHIVNNPIHAGVVERTEDWREWLRDSYVNILKETDSRVLIGHSCGSYHGLMVAKECPDIEGLVMLAPPYSTQSFSFDITRLTEYGFLDLLLAELCKDIDDERYKRMLDKHLAEYADNCRRLKNIYKNEIPRNDPESIEAVVQSIRSASFPILAILPKDDPWNSGELRDNDYGDHFSLVELPDSGHYPHISKPSETWQSIRNWMKARNQEASFLEQM